MPETNRTLAAPVVASWCVAVAALLLVLWLHLLPALLAGLLVFELVHVLTPLLQRYFPRERSRLAAVLVLSTLIVGLVTAAIFGTIAFFRGGAGSVPALLQKMADIVESTRNALPSWLLDYLPADTDELRETVSHWLREHAPEVRLAGAEAVRALAHVLIGMVIGAMASLHEARSKRAARPLALALTARIEGLGDAFRRVVFAQVRISALNTILTALYLAVVLPLAGVHLPLTKTLVGVTFVAGLLPIIGNLLSNAAIVVVSLAHSPFVALLSLLYLILIHKLEYFLNARIVGSQINAHAWELLVAMLVMEAAFGLGGLVAAPIYYAYLKHELADRGLV